MSSPKQIAVLGSFLTSPQSIEYAQAEELGFLLAKNGFHVLCGGHGGIAYPLVSGVARGEGVVRGIAMEKAGFPRRSARMNPRITEVINVHSVAERLETLAEADGFIFFTGGIGTLTEYFFIWHSLQVAADFGRPLILLSRTWGQLLAEIRLNQMIKHKYYRMVHLCERVKDAMALVTKDFSMKYDDPGSLFYKTAVFFNLDGSIVESPEEIFIRVCENNGYFFHPADVLAAFRKAGDPWNKNEEEVDRAQALLEELGIKGRIVAHLTTELSREFRQIPQMHEDAADILHYFKNNGFFTGVLSSRQPSQVQEILSVHSLSALFNYVGTPNRLDENLSPAMLEKALAGSGVRRDGIIHVSDILSAGFPRGTALGVPSILLDRYLAQPFDNESVTIRSFEELMHLVKHGASA
jgi:predicted Rossmann-fold nucleotide-binding protein/phosphoglycolate phosphatase-like HAD superfamily hydrolase